MTDRLPAEHVLAIEAATGVPKEELRPDIYPAEIVPNPTDLEPTR
jgi:DNA-binding transcriptional regulator YdaS (Cro superfamily)